MSEDVSFPFFKKEQPCESIVFANIIFSATTATARYHQINLMNLKSDILKSRFFVGK